MTCPKCGHISSSFDTAADQHCPRCGIVYAKYQADIIRARARARVLAKQETPRRLALSDVILICVGIMIAMLAVRRMFKPVSITHVLLLVPFLMCIVPTVSSVFGEGLYHWNRRRMTFEIFDSAAHPGLFRLQQLFYCICAVIIAIFFFRF